MTNTKKSNGRNTAKGRRTKKVEPISPTLQIVKVGARSVLFSLFAAFLLMFIGTAIVFNTVDPCVLITPISLSSLYLSSIFCGFLSSKLYRSSPLTSGGVSGLMFILTVLIISLFLKPETVTFTAGIQAILFLSIIPAVFLGAFLGNIKIVKKHKSPYRRR